MSKLVLGDCAPGRCGIFLHSFCDDLGQCGDVIASVVRIAELGVTRGHFV